MTPAMTVRDVAEAEQVSTTTARGYFARREIPGAYRTQGTSGPWRVTVEDFERWRELRKAIYEDPWIRRRDRDRAYRELLQRQPPRSR